MDESLKIRLLRAIGNDSVMPSVLSSVMERTKAEYCAFITMRETELVYIMAESKDLSQHVPEIREKLKNTFRMFANGGKPSETAVIEKIFFLRGAVGGGNRANGRRIESYFLVPVAFGPRVRGVLFIGSVRKEAFGRKDIALFTSLADERDEETPLMLQVGSERDILERILEALPAGAALFSPDGRIVGSNAMFRALMNLDGERSESVYDLGRTSCFNLHGIWEEFNILQRTIIDRELEGSCVPERYLSVSWVRLDTISPEVGSLSLLRETTSQRRQSEAREEEVAIVAHELRTPLAALKSSLEIVRASSEATDGSGESRRSGSGFIANAVRTVDRLGRLLDGLLDSSTVRLDTRPFRIEQHDTRGFLDEITMLFVHPLEKRGIDFSIEVDDACKNAVFDRDRMEQVIHNLLANSMKHVPAGGSISLSVRPCAGCSTRMLPPSFSKLFPSIEFADLALRDSGSGIPRNIAEMSNAAEDTERSVKASHGLGLIIAKRLMRMQGGSLLIEEGVGRGSAVHLFLPINRETARIVKRYQALRMKVDEAMARGLGSAIYVIAKEPSMSWEEIAERCSPVPVVNPEIKEMRERDAMLWLLSEEVSAALVARMDRIENPSAFLDAPLRIGWAISPREGTDTRALVSIAVQRMEDEHATRTLKGVVG